MYRAPVFMAPRRPPPGSFHDLGTLDLPAFGGSRRVRLYEPQGRKEGVVRPVLYLFDGQNIFGHEGSFAGGWFAHEAVDKLIARKQIVAPLVVALDNGGAQRIEELAPFSMGGQGGRTKELIDWMAERVVPEVRRRFAVPEGALGGVVGGSSLGGLAALYAHHERADLFGGALCMSPSFWFAGGQVFHFVAEREKPPFSRIYLDCGTGEGRGRMMPLVEHMGNLLRERGYDGPQLMVRADKRGQHNEKHWRRRLPTALKFMFTV